MSKLYRLHSYFATKKWYDLGFELSIFCLVFFVPLIFSEGFYLSFETPKTFIFRFFLYLASIFFAYKAIFVGLKINGIFRNKLFLFFLIAVPVTFSISCIFSIAPAVSFWGSYSRQQGAFAFIHYFVFFLLLLLNSDSEFLKRLLWVAATSFLCVIFYGFLQVLGFKFDNFNTDLFLGRIYATFGNPTAFASFIILMFFPFLYLFFSKADRVLRMFGIAMSFIFFIDLFFNKTRSSMLGLLAGVFLYFLISGLVIKKRKTVLLALIIPAVCFVFISAVNIFGDNDFFHNNSVLKRFVLSGDNLRSIETRLNMWPSNIDMIIDRPLFGHGPDTFSMAYSPYFDKDLLLSENLSDFPDRSHNIILQWLSDFGIIGSLIFLFGFVCLFVLLITNTKQNFYLKLSLFISLFAVFISHMFAFSSTEHLVYGTFILAYFLALNGDKEIVYTIKIKRVLRALIFLAFIFIEIIFVLPISIRIAQADFNFSIGSIGLKHGFGEIAMQKILDASHFSPNHGFYDYSVGEIYYSIAQRAAPNDVYDILDSALFFANRANVFFNSNDVETSLLLGKIYGKNFVHLGVNGDLAEFYFDNTKRLAPNRPEVYFEEGKYWFDKKDFQKAVADFEKYLSLCPDTWKYKNDTAWLSNSDNAFKYRMFYKANPDFDDVFYFAAQSYNMIGEKSKYDFYSKFVK